MDWLSGCLAVCLAEEGDGEDGRGGEGRGSSKVDSLILFRGPSIGESTLESSLKLIPGASSSIGESTSKVVLQSGIFAFYIGPEYRGINSGLAGWLPG